MCILAYIVQVLPFFLCCFCIYVLIICGIQHALYNFRVILYVQAVYIKRGGVFQDSSVLSKASDATRSFNPLDSAGDKSDLLVAVNEDTGSEDDDDKDDSDQAEGFSGFQNILKDMIPVVKVKVFKVTAPGKVDRDLISRVIEQIIEEDDEEKDNEIESIEAEEDIKSESDQESNMIELDTGTGISESEERNEISVKVVVDGLVQKMSNGVRTKDMLRVPAKLEKKGRSSFSFSIEKDVNQQDSHDKEQASVDKKSRRKNQPSIDHLMLDLTKFIGKEKIPLKVTF